MVCTLCTTITPNLGLWDTPEAHTAIMELDASACTPVRGCEPCDDDARLAEYCKPTAYAQQLRCTTYSNNDTHADLMLTHEPCTPPSAPVASLLSFELLMALVLALSCSVLHRRKRRLHDSQRERIAEYLHE